MILSFGLQSLSLQWAHFFNIFFTRVKEQWAHFNWGPGMRRSVSRSAHPYEMKKGHGKRLRVKSCWESNEFMSAIEKKFPSASQVLWQQTLLTINLGDERKGGGRASDQVLEIGQNAELLLLIIITMAKSQQASEFQRRHGLVTSWHISLRDKWTYRRPPMWSRRHLYRFRYRLVAKQKQPRMAVASLLPNCRV